MFAKKYKHSFCDEENISKHDVYILTKGQLLPYTIICHALLGKPQKRPDQWERTKFKKIYFDFFFVPIGNNT